MLMPLLSLAPETGEEEEEEQGFIGESLNKGNRSTASEGEVNTSKGTIQAGKRSVVGAVIKNKERGRSEANSPLSNRGRGSAANTVRGGGKRGGVANGPRGFGSGADSK